MTTMQDSAFLCPVSIKSQGRRGGGKCSSLLGSRTTIPYNGSLPTRKRARFLLDDDGWIITTSQHHQPTGKREREERIQHRDVYFATCARGLGTVLAREVQAQTVKGEVLEVASSGVRFTSSEPHHITGYRACLWLRTAMRVLLEISFQQLQPKGGAGSFRSPDMSQAVYDFVKTSTDWSSLLDAGSKSFSIQVRVSEDATKKRQPFLRKQRGGRSERDRAPNFDSFIASEHTVQVRSKDAICDALRDAGFQKPPRPTSHAESDIPLFITLHGSAITLYLDMAGASLHKRGYRSDGALHKSSLNESVAAGMLYMAGFQPDGSFESTKKKTGRAGRRGCPLTIVDPMCGSGTLLIEAALLRLRVAVGLYRKHFAFQGWADFDEATFQQLIEEAVLMQRSDDEVEANFIGSDINPSALALARRDLERTRLTNIVSLHRADARELALPAPPTITISNPPWGLRLGGELTAWESMGRFLREYAGGCTAVFLSGDAGVTRGLRMKARTKIPVRIGNVDTRVLIYDVLPKLEDGERRILSTGKDRKARQSRGTVPPPHLSEREMPIL